jgi:hypothetical protein
MKDLTAKNLNDADKKLRDMLRDRMEKKLFNQDFCDVDAHNSFNRDLLELLEIDKAFEQNKFDYVLRDNQVNGIDTIQHENGLVLLLSAHRDYTFEDLQEVLESLPSREVEEAEEEETV